MKIEFRKVTKDLKSFSITKDELIFCGEFKKISNSIVELDIKLKGRLLHSCDGCADEFYLVVDEVSKLKVCDGTYSGDDIDIVESLDGFIDFDEIFESEIEAIKSDYHYCEKCIEKFKE